MKPIRSSLWCRTSPRLGNISNDLCKSFSLNRGSFGYTEASKVRSSCDKSKQSLKIPRLLVHNNKTEAQPRLLASIRTAQEQKEVLQEFADPRILAKLGSKIGLTGNIVYKKIAYLFGSCKLPSLSDIEKCIVEYKNGFFSQTPAGPEKQMVNSSSNINTNVTSLLNLLSDKKEIGQPLKFSHNTIHMASCEPVDTEFYDSEVDFLYYTPAELVKNDSKVLPGDEDLFSPIIPKPGMTCSDNKDFEEYLKKNPEDKGPSCVSTETPSILSILNSVDKSAVIIQKDCYITNRILDSLKKKEEREKVKEKENLEASGEKEINYILNGQRPANLADLLLLTDKSNASLFKRAVEKAKQSTTINYLPKKTAINGMLTTASNNKGHNLNTQYE